MFRAPILLWEIMKSYSMHQACVCFCLLGLKLGVHGSRQRRPRCTHYLDTAELNPQKPLPNEIICHCLRGFQSIVNCARKSCTLIGRSSLPIIRHSCRLFFQPSYLSLYCSTNISMEKESPLTQAHGSWFIGLSIILFIAQLKE